MASLESAFGEETMADINPSLARENSAATECSEFHFNANSLTEQGQLCILDPHSPEFVDNEGLPTDQLTTAEKVSLENSAKAEAVWEYQGQSDKIVTNLSVPQQDKIISVKDEETNSQSSKQINNHNSQAKNLYFCERPKTDIQQPSLFAQYKNVVCASRVPMQNKQFNWERLEIYNSLVPDQNSQTKNHLIGDHCGENNQGLPHLFQYYKNAPPNENSAWQDQNCKSEVSSLIPEACYGSALVPVPPQAENIIDYVDEAVGPNTIQVTDERSETKNLHICDQCGKEYQWLSELIQHQLLYLGGAADRQDQLHLEGRNPSYLAPISVFLQENSMCATSWETFQLMSRDHNTHAKMLYLCHRSGKDFCRSSVLKWHIQPKEELTRQSESKINKSSTFSFVPHVTGNMFVDSCETSNLNSKLTSPYIGKQHNEQCGRCCHSLCAQQHLDNLKADRDELFHLEAYNPKNAMLIPLQAEKTLSEKSNIPIDQKNYAKNLYTSNCDKNNFQCHCLLTKHHRHIPLGGEIDTQDLFKMQAGCLSQFQMESKIIGSSETIKPQSNQTINQGFHFKSLKICTECGKDFPWSSDLAQYKVVHSGKASEKQCPSKVDDQNGLPPGLMKFDQPSHLKTNQSTQKNKSYTCGHCGKSFKWPSDHSRKKLMRGKGTKPTKSYICDQCGKHFYWPSHLAQHKQTHFITKVMRSKYAKLKQSYICGQCGKNFEWSKLAQHKCTHSRKKILRSMGTKLNKYYTRSQCGNSFQWPSQSVQHEYTHSRSKLVRGKSTKLIKSCICDQCGKSFTWPSDLARHERTHSRKKLLRGKCTKLNKCYTGSQCGKSFQCHSQLAKHEQTHSRSKLLRGKCTKLNKSYICDQCGKSFTWPSDLARHEHTHSRKKLLRGKCIKLNKSYICNQCGKSFTWPSDLARHEHTHSRKKLLRGKCTKLNKSYICDQCGKSFTWPSDLARHEHTHSRKKLLRGKCTKLNKSYICDQCGKSFTWPSDLARHEHTHSRKKLLRGKCTKLNKSYICDQCGKSFTWPSDLARHEHTHSRKKLLRGKCTKLNKSYICDQCGKSFTWPSDLARHEHTHSRKKLLREASAPSSTNPISVISVEKASHGLLILPDMNTLIVENNY
ncbi:zinc finger protein 268-like isoform X1 [Crotalus tigris]|uniref:zinc finger protein 268-like isoform X1 n=1 Tax=Crotalus tigris TaxID=88082 RepID=UPI00192FB352|nr:zinc finger protein 268-like isoform X1 [Crotalus tigris]XP_039203244.1 zinc finger protein 268-like isoform X1 [Crotalus tigris]